MKKQHDLLDPCVAKKKKDLQRLKLYYCPSSCQLSITTTVFGAQFNIN